MTLVLGIETSCDETSLCLMRRVKQERPLILSHHTFSQEDLLSSWGGVVPEISAREHLMKITPLLIKCVEEAKVSIKELDLIGVTVMPGLVGSLLVGLNTAKTLSLLHGIPLYPVNHLFAHLEAIHLSETIPYPYLGLLVSGGHSAFFLVRSSDDFELLGSTVDDAAGEAFDKGGKLLGLGYPAGKVIDDLAKKGNPYTYSFPNPMEDSHNCHMSFSGLKTAIRNLIEKNPQIKESTESLANVCASFQKAIVETLAKKMTTAQMMAKKILKSEKDLPLVVGGGVACNSGLRQILPQAHFVLPKFCTDNGAMVAHLALLNLEKSLAFPHSLSLDAQGQFVDKKKILHD